jgi:predicted ABC-type ATPase
MYILAGPNGAGKTTTANKLLREYLNCNEFVNADILAEGISDYEGSIVIKAARRTLEILRQLIDSCVDFAFETTLSGRGLENFVRLSRRNGYEVVLIFLWLDSPEIAVRRVRQRVKKGGHNIPEPDIRRRYGRGVINLLNTYIWLCNYWAIIDNTNPPQKIIAEGENGVDFLVSNLEIWNKIKAAYDEASKKL